jgi:hypothetical protein
MMQSQSRRHERTVTQNAPALKSAIHFCRDFVSIISTALISTGSIFENHRGIEGALSALDLSNNRFPGAMPQAQAHIAPLALTRTDSRQTYRLDLGFGAGSLSVAAAL